MRKTLQSVLFSFIILFVLFVHVFMLLSIILGGVINHSIASQRKLVTLFLKNSKTPEDFIYIQNAISISQQQSRSFAYYSKKIATIVPFTKVVLLADSLQIASLQLPKLLGSQKEVNFVLFLLNNYELRPGGGFIGSLGFITLKNYTMTKFEVQDVYEIDGQIKEHHEPHYAVRKYLGQPNEYLRDSNFSPDFRANTQNALKYLNAVPPYNKIYMGAVGITVSAFEDLLRIIGPIELADFKTTITSSNFFSTTQRKIETNFFPGSKQKRSILMALGNSVMQRLEEISPHDFINYIYRSVRTKNLVFYSSNEQLQSALSNVHATGGQRPSYFNWILPVDSNVGVNKLNAMVHKTMELQLIQSSNYSIQTFRSVYKNTVSADADRKETFKNYFQLYLPRNSTLVNAQINNRDVTSEIVTTRDETQATYGLYFETPPASSTSVAIEYKLPLATPTDRVEFMKQIGAESSMVSVAYSRNNTKIIKRQLESDELFILR